MMIRRASILSFTVVAVAVAVVSWSPSSLALAFVFPHCYHRHSSHSNTLFAATYGDGEGTQVEKSRSATSSSKIPSSNGDNSNNNKQPLLESLLEQAQQQLNSMKQENGSKNSGDVAGGGSAAALLFDILAQAFQIDPTSSKVSSMFMEYLKWKVEVAENNYYEWKKSRDFNNDDLHNHNNFVHDEDVTILPEKDMNEFFQDRIGLSSLYIDREQYDMAGKQLRLAIDEATFWIKCSSLQQKQDREPTQSSSSLCQDINADDLSSSQFQHWQPQIDRARYLLYRTNAACCQWDSYFEDGDRLRQSLLLHHRNQQLNEPSPSVRLLVHPFDALKFPCVSLELASAIAKSYANRSLETMGVIMDDSNANIVARHPRTIVTVDRHETQHQRQEIQRRNKKIRIGYISPDFTSRHPLAFLMQTVFAWHDKSQFTVNIYSLSSPTSSASPSMCDDDGQEVKAIRESSDQFICLSPTAMSPMEMYQRILQDDLDILVDLCGYAGTSIMSEVMAARCRLRQDEQQKFGRESLELRRRFPIHVSYMGFPGSVGSSMVWDYSVFDEVVAGGHLRRNYEEALVYMPHSYFVNSHKSAIGGRGHGILLTNDDERKSLRQKYGIPPSAFVYCCHSRPDKIDPTTFRSWMRALSRVWLEYQRASSGKMNEGTMTTFATVDGDATCCDNLRAHPVLWMLRSGDEMEKNLRQLVRKEFGQAMEEKCLVFADIAERREHLRRLGIADVFLDTPAYNAHTLGCGKSSIFHLSDANIYPSNEVIVDALYLGVPMVSLLRTDEGKYDSDVEASWKLEPTDADASVDVNFRQANMRSIGTKKIASRVGASLLRAVGLDELVYPDMVQYEDAMVRCALDKKWFDTIRQRLHSAKDSSPLFDTGRWMQNLERAFAKMVEQNLDGVDLPDIVVLDSPD